MDVDLTPVLLAVLGSTGLVGAVVAWRKLPQERTAITVEAGQGVIVMQDSLIQNLRAELTRLGERLDELETERERLRITARDLEYENGALRERVGALETELAILKNGGTA
jgi:predicted nuclease with TOPRIM domain